MPAPPSADVILWKTSETLVVTALVLRSRAYLTLLANKFIMRISNRRATELRNQEVKERSNMTYMWKENTDGSTEPTASTLATYKEALLAFTESAQKFIECIPLLTKSRDAYQKAIRASTELRNLFSDVGDQTLLTLKSDLPHRVVRGYVEEAAREGETGTEESQIDKSGGRRCPRGERTSISSSRRRIRRMAI